MQRKLIITQDGSPSIEIPEWNVTYHSVYGARQESMHVFIEAGLKYWEAQHREAEQCVVFEMGFGTGLNALLTLQEASIKIIYEAVEAYPLDEPLIQALNYQVNATPWNQPVQLTPSFSLKKIHTQLINYYPTQPVNIIYYDAFAPAAQPELWTEEVFKTLYALLAPAGILVTYCSKGSVRRALQAAGFTVEKLKGPPRKREMLRATKQRNN